LHGNGPAHACWVEFSCRGILGLDELSLTQEKTAEEISADERRRFQRVKINLQGRYMLPGQREFPCQIIDMSPGGLTLHAPEVGNVGDLVIVYLDQIGRIEGTISRAIHGGFAMTVRGTARKQNKLADQLTFLASRDSLNLPEDRMHGRVVLRNPIAVLTLEDGSKMTCRVIDLSVTGAAIAAESLPPINSLVTLGNVQSRVVRYLDGGFAVQFAYEQIAENLEGAVTAR
jgi:hypothetical protein